MRVESHSMVILTLLHYFSFMCVTMMVFSVCILSIFYMCSYLKAACDGLWFIMWLSHHYQLLVVISVLQRHKTNFNTSIGWYINIISINEITVLKCKFKLKCPNYEFLKMSFHAVCNTALSEWKHPAKCSICIKLFSLKRKSRLWIIETSRL